MGERNVRVMESECKGVEVGDVKGVGVWLVNTVAHLMRARPSVCVCGWVCVSGVWPPDCAYTSRLISTASSSCSINVSNFKSARKVAAGWSAHMMTSLPA